MLVLARSYCAEIIFADDTIENYHDRLSMINAVELTAVPAL